jgi:hypothetical protein
MADATKARARRARWRARNPAYGSSQARLVRYCLTPEQFAALVATQGGGCAACGTTDTLTVDHDHSCCPGRVTCGRCVRGALCDRCNSVLGYCQESVATLLAMVAYLDAGPLPWLKTEPLPTWDASQTDRAHYQRDYHLCAKYSVTPERFARILAAQGGGCAGCGAASGDSSGRRFHVDHDHTCCPNRPRPSCRHPTCGRCIRGLLCWPCNLILGRCADDPTVLLALCRYLETPRVDATTV